MHTELDNLVRGFFSVFDNRQNRKAKFADLQSMFVEGAVISKRTANNTEILSLASFWRPREALLNDGSLTDFHEWEVASETIVDGGIATRICHYKKAGLMQGNIYAGSGVKFINFSLTVDGWKITSILWEDTVEGVPATAMMRYSSDGVDGTGSPIPEYTLPPGASGA